MNLLKHYINYRLKAKGRHGIHSPFVYSFVNECLYTKVDKNFLSVRKKLFKILKKDLSTIEITDFGAGSKKLGKQRKISDIFKTSSSHGKYGQLLYKISCYYSPNTVLELGTSLGIGTIHLQGGNPNSKITTIEGCNTTLTVAKKNMKFFDFQSITTINSTFDTFFRHHNNSTTFDLVFIDGHHNGSALKNYIEQLKPITHNETIFILDDIRWSDSMFSSWEEICNDSYFNVSIDLFRMGIIIPRKQQVKEHFIIKL